MSQSEKAAYFQALKSEGVSFDKHYREYKTEELRSAYIQLTGHDLEPVAPPVRTNPAYDEPEFIVPPAAPPAPQPSVTMVPRKSADPNELPGQRMYSKADDEPIRVDDEGRVWYQEEIQKPGFAKPRARRVLKYLETGVVEQTETGKDGYVETFEVAGTAPGVTAEVKVSLPTYQVGIYKDPRFPFRIHTYNGMQGFDFFEVQDYYGGSELVPAECKRMYVENVLCYDIRTVIRAIQTEYRQLQLAGKVQ